MPIIGTTGSIRSFAWPWAPSAGGIPQQTTDADAVATNLLLLYSTEPGDDKTQLDFGLPLLQFVFETEGPLFSSLMESTVITTTEKWEPRANILSVDTEFVEDDSGVQAEITVEYEYAGTQSTVTFTRTQPQ